MRFKVTPRFLLFAGLSVCLTSGDLWLRNALAFNTGRIVYTSTRDGNSEIYVMDADGENQERLTNNPTDDSRPSWSPDGQQIAFVSNRNGGFIQIYVMDADGKNPTRLTDGVWDTDPDWSPDGQKIAFTSRPGGKGAHIAVMDADGHNVFKLTDGQVPSWSPDGTRVAFEFWDEVNQIYVINVNGQRFKKVTHDLANKSSPAWSPNGRQIAYCALHEIFFQIYVVGADGKNRRRITHNLVHHWTPAWSPDGGAIAYWISNVNVLDRATIHLMTVGGNYLKQLSDLHNGSDYSPDFGPGGLTVSPTPNQFTIWGRVKKLEPNRR